MKQVSYALKKGMKDTELLNELRGKVSGETGAELTKFFEVSEELPKFYGTDLPDGTKYDITNSNHEVVMEDGEHALLLKYEVRKGTRKVEEVTQLEYWKYIFTKENSKDAKRPSNEQVEVIANTKVEPVPYFEEQKAMKDVPYEELTRVFYLAGINDEGMYFVHKLEGLPIEKTKTMEEILHWANRADEGFATRWQGDILGQAVSGFTARIDYVNEGSRRQTLSGSKSEYVVGEDETTTRAQLYIRDLQKPFGDGQSSELIRDTRESSYEKGLFKTIKLGNHQLGTDGYFAVLKDQYVLAIPADKGKGTITLQHPEHGQVVQTIPSGHALILTGQRGRGLETKDGIQPSISRNMGFD